MQQVLEILLLIVGGFVAGSYGSVLGGGSLVSLPVLIMLGYPTDTAIGTNRFQIASMTVSTGIAYLKKKLIDWKIAISMALVAIPGSVFGASIVDNASEQTLNIVVAAALILVALLLSKLSNIKPSVNAEDSKLKLINRRLLILLILCFGLGVYGGFYGAGFRTFIIFCYIFLSGRSFLEASANSAIVGIGMSTASSIYFLANGLVDFTAAIPMLIGSVAGAQFGVSNAFKIEGRWIKRALLVMIIVSAARLIARSL